jgi:hypothetical protein
MEISGRTTYSAVYPRGGGPADFGAATASGGSNRDEDKWKPASSST